MSVIKFIINMNIKLNYIIVLTDKSESRGGELGGGGGGGGRRGGAEGRK